MLYETVSIWPGTPDVFLETFVPCRYRKSAAKRSW